ncbi:hypothetical protein HC231_01100 [Brenneria izadpanahii]|uniref:Uncharacterized protein n=1 Tax=Brenneria izadpanahii TaxID=2722756 RepID=A0ABX7UMC9_9GAMM|nr:hypothetical protein [Brenneria izadpanahii]QTF06689.1 hypothetical protein HC231_01100 [Brenneria izadpanahii]
MRWLCYSAAIRFGRQKLTGAGRTLSDGVRQTAIDGIALGERYHGQTPSPWAYSLFLPGS